MLKRLSVPAALFMAAALMPANAHAETMTARYDATLWGFSIGRAQITSRFDGDGFRLDGTFGSAGLARLFDPADGTATTSGRLAGGAVRPASFRLDYKSGKKRQLTALEFSGNRVSKTVNRPPLKKHNDNWVPLKKADLAGVSDPLTALMVPVERSGQVCGRKVDVFDGEMHARLVFSPAASGEALKSGAVTCRVRFVPVAGYRTNRDALKFLRDRAKILVAFDKSGDTGIFSPVEATIGTQVGTVHIRARPVPAK